MHIFFAGISLTKIIREHVNILEATISAAEITEATDALKPN